jgi:hypothetical protein
VILTAPPAPSAVLDPMGPVATDAPLPLGHSVGVSDSDASR